MLLVSEMQNRMTLLHVASSPVINSDLGQVVAGQVQFQKLALRGLGSKAKTRPFKPTIEAAATL